VIADKIERGGNEQGLLGLAFHPDYATNGWVFVNYTEAGSGDTVIARYEALPSRDRLDPDSEKRVLVIEQIERNHNGGGLQFGPDGMLWIAMGDGGGIVGAQRAQDDASPLGKLLRVDVDVEEAPFWQTPDDNPSPDAGGILSLVWSKGFRNPWRYSFDRDTGDLIIGDVGQNAVEEIDFQPADSSGGENYGWSLFEGTSCYTPPCPSPSGFVPPIHEYEHPPEENRSVTGGYVYRGCALPDLHGTYFYADWVSGMIASFEIDAGQAINPIDRTAELQPSTGTGTGNVSSFGEDTRGEIYLTDFYGGEVFKIVPE
jgi:glucose/arabinose dehydrogenase